MKHSCYKLAWKKNNFVKSHLVIFCTKIIFWNVRIINWNDSFCSKTSKWMQLFLKSLSSYLSQTFSCQNNLWTYSTYLPAIVNGIHEINNAVSIFTLLHPEFFQIPVPPIKKNLSIYLGVKMWWKKTCLKHPWKKIATVTNLQMLVHKNLFLQQKLLIHHQNPMVR